MHGNTPNQQFNEKIKGSLKYNLTMKSKLFHEVIDGMSNILIKIRSVEDISQIPMVHPKQDNCTLLDKVSQVTLELERKISFVI